MNDEVIASIRDSVLCWLATVNAAGEPNVSPKEMFVADGTTRLLIANIASPQSVRNIEENPRVCVSFVNVFKQKGFKLKGLARIIQTADPEFQRQLSKLHELGGEAYPVKSIIAVDIDAVSPIVAPSYWLFPETTVESQIEQAMITYGVVAGK